MAIKYDKSLYLTDEQYMAILLKIKAKISEDKFKPFCYDSITPGNKFTRTNCGFCNEEFTDKKTALFPESFPKRMTMKYRRGNHKCPFDMREELSDLSWGNGCFYKCYLFKLKVHEVDVMRVMVEEIIKKVGEQHSRD